MAAKFSRFHENRSYQTGNAGLAHFEDDEPTVEKATLDEHIAEENIGYQMALRLGWETGTGLGRKKQGRTEPIPLVMKEDFLCIGRLALEFAQADEATSQRRALEIEKEETDELQQKYQNELEKEKTIEESLRDLKEMFYCEMCDKQYFKYKEYDNHINSYDHAHRQRLRELRQRESTRNIYAKKKKEQKQMEKEMQRLHLLSGKSAESQSSSGFQVAFKGSAGKSSASSGFKPITVQKGFTAVPPPPAESPPPLPSEPAPPLPSEPPPPLPPSDDQPVKKPFSFKLGGGQGDAAEKTTSTKPGLSFSLGKKQAPGVQLFGVKSKPIKSTASAFMESDSEEEEEEDSPEENSGVYEGEDLPSTPTQQQDTLEKVIEYADTLKLKEALRPRLLIRFVKGTAMNGVLPGTLSTPEGDQIKKKAHDSKRDSKEERRESKHKSKKSRHKKKEPSERQFKESKDIREETSDRLFKESKLIKKETSDRQFMESKDIRKETRDSTESRDHKESQEERKTSSRKKESHESKRGFRERWDDSSRTKTIKEKRS